MIGMGMSTMPDASELYERDFVRWSEEQATALRSAARSGTNLPLDWDHLAEEIDSLGKSLRSELRDRLATIVEHLIKLQVSPANDPRAGWMETIERERVDVELLLRDNPSLRATLSASLDDGTFKAKRFVKSSLQRYGEHSPQMQREIDRAHFSVEEVMGPWPPKSPPDREA